MISHIYITSSIDDILSRVNNVEENTKNYCLINNKTFSSKIYVGDRDVYVAEVTFKDNGN